MSIDDTSMLLGEINNGLKTLGRRVDREARAASARHSVAEAAATSARDDLAAVRKEVSDLTASVDKAHAEIARITPVTDRVKRAEVLFWAGASVVGLLIGWMTWASNKGAALWRAITGGAA